MTNQNRLAAFPTWAKALIVLLLVVVGLQTWLNLQLMNDRKQGKPETVAKVAEATPLYENHRKNDSVNQDNESEKKTEPRPKSSLLPDLFSDNEGWPTDPFNSKDWDPFVEMRRMREQMEQLFGESLGKFERSDRFSDLFNDSLPNSPRVDMKETDDGYEVVVDLPGIESSSINVQLEDNTLHITAESQMEKQSNKSEGNMLSRERRVGRFERTITFSEPVIAAKLKSEFENGVLRVTVPRANVS